MCLPLFCRGPALLPAALPSPCPVPAPLGPRPALLPALRHPASAVQPPRYDLCMLPRLRLLRHTVSLGRGLASASGSLAPRLVEALFPDATHLVLLDSSLTTSGPYQQTQSIIVPGGDHAGPLGFSLTHSVAGPQHAGANHSKANHSDAKHFGANYSDTNHSDSNGPGTYEVTGGGFVAEAVRKQVGLVLAGRGGFYDVLRAGLSCGVDREELALGNNRATTDFSLGWVGALGYELKHHSEWVRCSETAVTEPHRSTHPDAALLWADRAVVIDHETGSVHLLALTCQDSVQATSPQSGDAPALGGAAQAEPAHIDAVQRAWIEEALETLDKLGRSEATSQPEAITSAETPGPLSSRTTRVASQNPETVTSPSFRFTFDQDHEEYLASIRQTQEFIAAGDTYEVCLTNTAEGPALPDPWQTYLSLRATSPVPYGSYLRFGDLHVLSASPERFISVSSEGRVSAKPIKGTRPRSGGGLDDEGWRRDLENSEKDRAENLMIVDLLRNDLSMVAEAGSVAVTRLFGIETYSHVHQMVSTIEAQLAAGKTAVDALEVAFPGGSMTGAPKVRTMELIEGLERRARGLYSGAIGWLGLGGAADLSITIRTLVADRESTTFGVGGAIVADSDPEAEWQEILVKASALLEALGAELGIASQ